jgi:hypothetical protein
LKFISLGSYRTPLYYNGSDSYSTACGGALTLILYIGLFVYSVFILASIFKMHNYIVEEYDIEIGGLTTADRGATNLTCIDCEVPSLRDAVPLILNNSYYYVTFPVDEQANCTDLRLSVNFTKSTDLTIELNST